MGGGGGEWWTGWFEGKKDGGEREVWTGVNILMLGFQWDKRK